MFEKPLLAVLLVYCFSPRTWAQKVGCNSTISDAQVTSLIASSFGTTASNVVLHSSRILCLSSSGVRNYYRFVSIVANFTYSGGNITQTYAQFEFECVNSVWSAASNILGPIGTARTLLKPDDPAITASLRTDCAYCLSPAAGLQLLDQVHHCYPCIGCSQPLCYVSNGQYPQTLVLMCCNAFLSNGTCAVQCPSSYSIDGNGICGYNIFDGQYGVLVAIAIALAVGILIGLCCCIIFSCVCCRMKTVHKKKQATHVRSPTFSDDKTVFSELYN